MDACHKTEHMDLLISQIKSRLSVRVPYGKASKGVQGTFSQPDTDIGCLFKAGVRCLKFMA